MLRETIYPKKLNTDTANVLYDRILDYHIMCGDPLYNRLHKFTRQILALTDTDDRRQLTAYLESETGKPLSYFKHANA